MSRCRAALAVFSVISLLLTAWAGPATAAGSRSAQPGAAAKATYSRPLWFPLRGSEVAMDCAWSNPGCSNGHTDHAITWLTHDSRGVYRNVLVYAAGAGIVHIGHVGMGQCSPTPGQPLGNWVWVDHGNGVISRYAHLYGIAVTNGQQVTERTALGKSGSSGEPADQCHIKYLNFQIQHGAHGAANGTGIAFTGSYACHGSTRVTYPRAIFYPRYPTWNSFPKSTFVSGQGWINMIPTSGTGCR